MKYSEITAAARGEKEVDLLLTGGRIINVYSGEITEGSIAVDNGYIVGFGDYRAKETVDLQGRFIAPGFIDPHVHIESSMTSVTEFARSFLPCGTTTIVADPHEIANVLGTAGIQYMLDSAVNQPANIFFALPSCVPATDMETSGASLSADDLEPFMGHEKVLALAEMMNFPGVIYGAPEVLKKIALAKRFRKPVDGHAPFVSGKELSAYVSAGILSDHECTTPEEAMEKLSLGMHIMVREGTCARNLDALFPVINDRTAHRMMWCTDDRHPHDLMDDGHINAIVRSAVKKGLDPVTAIRMATLNPAEYFGIRDAGAIAPGKKADMVVFSDLSEIHIESVYCGGILVAENGHMAPDVRKPAPVSYPPSMNVDTAKIDFTIRTGKGKARVIDLVADQVVTGQFLTNPPSKNGFAESDTENDILKLAVVERHSGKTGTGLGFVRGFNLKKGALASSVGHDSHNIIVVGTSDADMLEAVREVVDMGGGFCAASGGRVRATLPLPIAGLMSEDSVPAVRRQLDEIIAAAKEFGTSLHDPFMALGFLSLPVIPDLKLTDKGLVDVTTFKIVPLFEKE